MRAELVGQRFGELVVAAELPREERVHGGGNRDWMCLCDCGGRAIRTTGQLRQSQKNGWSPCCAQCLKELSGGRMLAKRTERHEHLLSIWNRYGTLYSWFWELAERDSIVDELAPEYGYPSESSHARAEVPRMTKAQEATYWRQQAAMESELLEREERRLALLGVFG